MSQFKRKEQGGFQASDHLTSDDSGNAGEPDFSALEPESGFSAGELGQEQFEVVPEPKSELPQAGSSAKQSKAPSIAPGQVEPVEAGPAKKRYYSPNEVMRKKGCIGCGGMVLAVPFLVAVIGIVIAIL